MASKVGEAYVLVHTRTRPLSPAQKRALNRDAGDAAKAWTSRFGKEVEEAADRQLGDLQRTLAETFASGDFDGLRRQFNDTSKTVDFLRANLRRLQEQKQLNSKEFDTLERQINRWEKTALEADRNLRQINDAKHFDAYLAKQEAFNSKKQRLLLADLNAEIRNNDALNRTREQVQKQATRVWDQEFARLERETEQREKLLRSAYRMNEQFDRRRAEQDARRLEQMRRMQATAYRMNEEFNTRERQWLAERLNMHVSHLDDWSQQMVRSHVIVQREYERTENGATRFTRTLARTNRQMRTTADVVGTLFGRGSRNNFLNFIGSTMRNLMQIPVGIGKAFIGVVDNLTAMGSAFAKLAPQIGGFRAAAVILRGPLIALTTGLLTLGVAAGIMVKLLPALASLVSGLTGIMVAWAGVLVNAILGGLLALVPVLIAVGGGFVALGIAVTKYYQEMKRRKEDGEALTAGMQRMDDAVTNMGKSLERFTQRVAPEASRSFAILADAASGFMDAIGPGVEEGLRRFNNILSGESLAPALAVWRESLPRIFEDFTAGLGHMTAGIIKFFEPILPYAERLSTAFYDMMLNFSAWAGSAEGKNTIADWMDMAWQSASALWNTLGNLLGVLGSLFNIGTDTTGLDWLKGLEETTRRWNEELKTEEGRKRVTEWFEHAREVGELLWGILEDIGKFFKDLDTQTARDDLTDTLDSIKNVTDALDDVATGIEKASELLDGFFGRTKIDEDAAGNLGASLGNIIGQSAQDSFDQKVLKILLPPAMYKWIDELDQKIADEIDGVTPEGQSFLGLDEWFNDLRSRWDENIAAWIRDRSPSSANTGNTAIDAGALLGLRDEGSFLGVDEWFNRLTERWGLRLAEWLDSVHRTDQTGIDAGLALGLDPDGSFLGLDEWFNSLRRTWRQKIEDFLMDIDRTGDPGLDAGAMIGLDPSFLGLDEWFLGLMGKWGENMEGFVTRVNEDMKDGARRAFMVDGETWSEIGGNIWTGFKEGLSQGIDQALQPFRDFYEDVKEFFGIASPSTVFITVGSDVMQGFINGLEFVFLTLPGIIAGWLLEMTTQFSTWATGLPGQVAGWLATLPAKFMENWDTAKADLTAWMLERGLEITTWVTGIPDKVRDGLNTLATKFLENWETAKADLATWRTNTANDIKTWAEGIPGSITSWLSGVASAIAAPFEAAWSPVNEALSAIYTTASGWWESIRGVVNNILNTSSSGRRSYTQMLGGGGVRPPYMAAAGGWFDGATNLIVGEAGPEVVVPLNRPLSLVDPSVRMLSALLQGKSDQLTRGSAPGRSIVFTEGSIVVQTMATDVVGVAEGVVDRIAVAIGN